MVTVNVHDFGAMGDTRDILDAVMLAHSPILQSMRGDFSEIDVGKIAEVAGAGIGGAALCTVVKAFLDSRSVVLAKVAAVAVTNVLARIGTDDTVALQTSVNAANMVVVPAGNYLIHSIKVPSNRKLVLDPAAVITKITAPAANAMMLWINNRTNVTIEGGTIDGGKPLNKGGQTHGIGITGGHRIRIRDVRIINMPTSAKGGDYGDGIYVGSGPEYAPVRDLVIDGCTIDHCDRHCVFFVSVSGAKLVNCTLSNTDTNNPGSAINLEPNYRQELVENVTISGCEVFGNCTGVTANNHYSPPVDNDYNGIHIVGCSFYRNRRRGIEGAQWGNGCSVVACQFNDNAEEGISLWKARASVSIASCSFRNNRVGLTLAQVQFFKLEACDFVLNQQEGAKIFPGTEGDTPHFASIVNCQFWNNGTAMANTHDGLLVYGQGRAYQECLTIGFCWFGNHPQYASTPTQRYGVKAGEPSGDQHCRDVQFIGNGFSKNLTGDVLDSAGNFYLHAAYSDSRPNFVLGSRLRMGNPNETGGFMFVPSCAAEPTGVPGALSPVRDGAPVVVDTVHSRLWVFTSGGWKSVPLT